MKCILSHTAACIWYTHNSKPRESGDRASRVSVAGACLPPSGYLDKLAWMLSLQGTTLDFLVDDRSKLRNTKRVRSHLCTHELPAGSLIQIPSGYDDVSLYITSPELTFSLVSFRSSVQTAVYTGMALCSDYRLDDDGIGGVTLRPEQAGALTSVRRIRQYLERSSSIPGKVRALAALKHVHAHARSPKESALAMFYGLPALYGGMALGDVVLNPLINVYAGKDELGGTRVETRYPDILITRRQKDGSDLGVAFDYDSVAAHSGAQKVLADKRRANSIATVSRLTHYSISTDDLGDFKYLLLLGERARRFLKGRKQPCLRVSSNSEMGRAAQENYRKLQRALWEEFVIKKMLY